MAEKSGGSALARASAWRCAGQNGLPPSPYVRGTSVRVGVTPSLSRQSLGLLPNRFECSDDRYR